MFSRGCLHIKKEKEEKTFKEKDREKAGSNWQKSQTLPAFTLWYMGGDEDSEISIWERAVEDTADKLLCSAAGPCHRAGYPACGK